MLLSKQNTPHLNDHVWHGDISMSVPDLKLMDQTLGTTWYAGDFDLDNPDYPCNIGLEDMLPVQEKNDCGNRPTISYGKPGEHLVSTDTARWSNTSNYWFIQVYKE
jgi:hypothetical protein